MTLQNEDQIQEEIDKVATTFGLAGYDKLIVVVRWPRLASILRWLLAALRMSGSYPGLMASLRSLALAVIDGIKLQNEWENRARLASAEHVNEPVNPEYLGLMPKEMGTVYEGHGIMLKVGDSAGQWIVSAEGCFATVYLQDQQHLIILLELLGRIPDKKHMDKMSMMKTAK